jgi:hypothetical protein
MRDTSILVARDPILVGDKNFQAHFSQAARISMTSAERLSRGQWRQP